MGMVVLVAGIIMALLALCFGGKDYAWLSLMVLCLIIFGIVIISAFVVIEWKILLSQLFPSAISVGLHLLLYTLPISIFSTISGFVVTKTGCYCELLWVGGSITTISARLYVFLDDSTSTGKSIGLTIIGSAGMGLLLQPMLLALQTAIQPCDMATGTTLFVAICMHGGSIGLAIFQTVHSMHIDQAVVCTSSMLPKLSQALIDAYVVALRAIFYASIPFAIMIILLAVFVHHILLHTCMAKTTAGIHHILLVERLLAPDEDLALLPLAQGLYVIYPDDLSPALANVCRMRFSCCIPTTRIESIKREVLRSLEEGIQAVTINLEAIDIEHQPGEDG
ncbi:hypothetical protein H4S07_000457 [Coemansia furcata]|uniref:Uncharacterized protein n=1 Tax=Coemansia furcata TaxID=417177 RepID=A0ACC1LR40_9FUNG|nr:hypothetical protein H4S07_000457 [Coemansia furcata]